MSSNEFILNWLNKDLKIVPFIKNISKEFSNGYKFAEVLQALNELTEKEKENFQNSTKYEEIKMNFNLLKNILHDKLNLDIREEEFIEVINRNIATATIILYKIKNSISKKKMNFLNINISSNQLTKEEIKKKVLELLDNESYKEINQDEEEELIKTKTKNNRYYIKRYTQNTVDINSIESDSNDFMTSDKNLQYKNMEKKSVGYLNINIDNSNSNKSKKLDIIMYKKSTNIMANNTNSNINKKLSVNNTFESKKDQLTLNTMETMEFNTINIINNINGENIQKNIRSLKPFSGNFNFKNIKNEGIFPKILPKINTNTNFEYKSSIMNSNVGYLSNNSLFNKKLNTINTYNYNNTNGEIDFRNDYGIKKIKELNDKIHKKNDDTKRQEKIKNELQLKKEYEVKEKYQLDFINKIKNPLYRFTKFTGVNLFMHTNSKYNSCNKRLEYSKELKEKAHKEEINQQIENIKKIMNNESKTVKIISIDNNLNIKNKSNLMPFNKIKYFKKLNNLNKADFNISLIKKQNKEKEAFPLIKKVTYSIIDLMEDMYDYQYDNDKEIIELEDFKMFSDFFIKGKQKEKIVIDNEDLLIKSSETKDDIIIDINNLILNEDEKYMIQDYINYIGIWNDGKILNHELKGYKFDIKKIKSDLPLDYEPTENEIDDITLPVKLNDNYTLGNTLLNLIDTKYSLNKEKETKENSEAIKENININNINKDDNNLSKWNYIPFKLSLVGYPLSGRKYIAENLNKKYPYLKIYSIKKILRDYYIEYKTITERIDGNPKYKSLKPNQITQLKEDREKQLVDFNPILNIIKPYIDFISCEKLRKKLEEEKKKEKESISNTTKRRKSILSPNKRGSPMKKRKSIAEREKEEEFVEENINDDLKIIPNDEVLFNLLVYKIENDFPLKSKEVIDNEIIEKQTKIFQILKNIENLENQKKETAKPNPKDDITINNLQKDLENIKLESIKGFILVDYPCNIIQSILLENYLTGYVDEIQRPKSEKNKIINNLSSFIDFKIMPKKNNIFKRAGIDFVINIISHEKNIDQRFASIKYDPISDKIYTNSDLSEENKNKQPLDKKIVERLINDVPYLTRENFDFYKEEYNNNISLISSLYNKFGIYVDVNTSKENQIILGMDFSEKELKRAFQSIELDTKIDITKKVSIVNNSENNEKNLSSPKKRNSIKRSSIRKPSMKKGNKNEEIIENKSDIFDLEEKNKNKILDFISNNIINWLFKEKNKSDKMVFYSRHPEYNTNEENDRIKFDPELKVNEINNEKSRKTIGRQNVDTSMAIGEPRISLLNKNSEYIIKELSSFNQKYNKYLGIFIYSINIQKNSIYKRLNLVQKKFRDFLNIETNKKKVLHIYATKYNEFFRDKPNFFDSAKATEEFSADIEEVNNNLWILINEKEKESINELESIKNCGFIEKELEKFYENMKEIFLVETERFLIMINSIIYLYSYGNKNVNSTKKEDSNNYLFRNNIKRDSNKLNEYNNKNLNNSSKNINSDEETKEKMLNEMYYDKNYIIKDINNINFDSKEATNSFVNTTNNIMKKISYKKRKESKNELIINNLIGQITNNIEIIFMNCIKLILEYQDIIDKLIKDIKSTVAMPHKKYYKRKNTKFNISSNNSSMMTSMYGVDNPLNEKIIKMLQNEKNKYKYRMCYLKSFTYRYMAIITQTAQNIYNNLDQWIVTSVSLQNDALNIVISILKKKLKNHRLINEKKEINTIEMDAFEKIHDNEEGIGSEIGLKPIDNSSVGIGRIYNKINIDYLINDNFIDIKVEEILKSTENEEKNKNRIFKNDEDVKIKNKLYKMILPNELDRSINSSINNSFGIGAKNKLKEFDFYFDMNKFNIIYKNIKKYEIEENIISKDLFYEIFIKQYLIDKYSENSNENEKVDINMGIKNINKMEKNRNNQRLRNNLNISNESDEEDDNIKSINDHLIKNQKNFHPLNGICNALKMLSTKHFNKIYNLYQIHVEHKTQTNQEHLERRESINISINETKKEEYKDNDNEINKEYNENIQKEIKNNNDKDKVEYDIYLNTSEIFTILPLIGCKIMNLMEEENVMKDLKEKLIREKYLLEKDFMEYRFWFEQELEYQNEDLMFQQMLEESNNISPNKKSNFRMNENKKIHIKEFLFNIWKDEKGDKIDFQKLLSVLKINKYITDLNGLNDENYYNIIFNSEA